MFSPSSGNDSLEWHCLQNSSILPPGISLTVNEVLPILFLFSFFFPFFLSSSQFYCSIIFLLFFFLSQTHHTFFFFFFLLIFFIFRFVATLFFPDLKKRFGKYTLLLVTVNYSMIIPFLSFWILLQIFLSHHLFSPFNSIL